jgi:hypothetical protein
LDGVVVENVLLQECLVFFIVLYGSIEEALRPEDALWGI